jgi:hypothetical protein
MSAQVNVEKVSTYCIWTKTGHRPTAFHNSLAIANAEANRLALKNPGKKFIVMRMMRKFGAVVATDAQTTEA